MRIINPLCTITTIVLLGISSLSVFSEERSKPYAKVMYATGTVSVFRTAQAKAEPLSRGDFVSLGNRITTGPKSKCILITNQRKLITLLADSELKTGSGKGRTLNGLGLGLFARDKTRSVFHVQATTRKMDADPLLLNPRFGLVRSKRLVLEFAPLRKGERYAVEVVGVTPMFYYRTEITEPKLALTNERIGKELTHDVAYYVDVFKLDAGGTELAFDKGLRVGMLGPRSEETIETFEKELMPLVQEDEGNPAYPTLLAETYEDHFLFHDAIGQYEKIVKTVVPGDSYSLERLKYLYEVIQNPVELKALEVENQSSVAK